MEILRFRDTRKKRDSSDGNGRSDEHRRVVAVFHKIRLPSWRTYISALDKMGNNGDGAAQNSLGERMK